MESHGGEVPETFEALEKLAGVGHKTASVVLAVAFKMPTFPVDTHIYRCPLSLLTPPIQKLDAPVILFNNGIWVAQRWVVQKNTFKSLQGGAC